MFRTCRSGFADWSKFRPYRYAHRGLHDIAHGIPENSLPAFRRAAEHGFGVELDVHLTTDGRLVVIHDGNLKRLLGIDRKANTLSSEEYRNYGILGTEHTAPMLEDVLPLFAGIAPIILEIKVDGNAAAVTEAACKVCDRFRTVVCMESFHPRAVAWLRKHRPDYVRGQLSYDYVHDTKDTIHPLLRGIMAGLYSNILTKPDFIAYRFADRAYPAVRHCREKYGVQEVSWTITNQADLETAEADGCIVIFEGFLPK